MQCIEIPVAKGIIHGDLIFPSDAKAIIIFAHGSGSSRHSPRNQNVAQILQQNGFGTLLFDLLTIEEEAEEIDGEYRFNIELLTERLVLATQWVHQHYSRLPIGYFGASTGAAAALKASLQNNIFAIVSRGGRPDLAKEALSFVKAPTLLIVGSLDSAVLEMNKEAAQKILSDVQIAIVEGATHLFEEAGKIQEVAQLAVQWFLSRLKR